MVQRNCLALTTFFRPCFPLWHQLPGEEPFREANSRFAFQETLLYFSKISPISLMNQIRTFSLCFFKHLHILPSHLCPFLPSGLLHSAFPSKTLGLFFPSHACCFFHVFHSSLFGYRRAGVSDTLPNEGTLENKWLFRVPAHGWRKS